MIARRRHLARLGTLLQRNPAVALIGARQVGKSTLARAFAADHEGPVTFLDLEDPADAGRVAEPMLGLRHLRGLVVLDEVQRAPAVWAPLRVLCDRPDLPARFLLLGSATPELVQRGSESLAGRIAWHELPPLALDELGPDRLDALWLRGGYPRSFLAASEAESADWRRDLFRSVIERDLPALGFRTPAETLHRFWAMLAHWHGQTWNSSEFARAFGVADTTVRGYLDALAGALLVRLLPAWHENVAKRQVRAPKVYVRDSGLLHSLLGATTREALDRNPRIGASWEGFALETVLALWGARREEAYFWATHGGAELDLLLLRGEERLGFEFKRTEQPTLRPSMRIALEDLGLRRLRVVHAGSARFPLADGVEAVPLAALPALAAEDRAAG